MQPDPVKRILVKFFIPIGTAIVILGGAGDAFNVTKDIANSILEYFGFPNNRVNRILLISLVILAVAAIVALIKWIFRSAKKSRIKKNSKNARENYIRWVKMNTEERIKSSIHHAVYIDLGLIETNKYIDPWGYKFHSNKEESNKSIGSFNELLQKKPYSILLLGAPGAGKTTTLLNAVQQCIVEAEADKSKPVPLILNLSGWRKKEAVGRILKPHKWRAERKGNSEIVEAENFRDWVVSAASGIERSGLSPEIVEEWLRNEKVVLFLDGLDEAQESFRGTMVGQINVFLDDNPGISTIVCSRSADYEALVNTKNIKLELDAAVTIEPLTPQQINDYLIAAKATPLQLLLENDRELKEMAKSPLELSIMVLASVNTDFGKLIGTEKNSITAKRVALFDAYVIAMVQREERRSKANRLKPESDLLRDGTEVPEKKIKRINKYLAWIGGVMSERSRSSFSPNRLYEYLFEQKNYRSPGYINIVHLLLLMAGYAVICVVFWSKINTLFLLSAPLVFIGGVLLALYSDNSNTIKWKSNAAGYSALWTAILVLVSFILLPLEYLISLRQFVIWIYLAIYAVAVFLVLYVFNTWDGFSSFIFRSAKKHLLAVLFLVIPIVWAIFFDIRSDFKWVFIYSLLTTINVILVHNIMDIRNNKRKYYELLGYNVYAISAGVCGILLLHAKVEITILLFLEIVMAVGIISFSSDRDFKSFGIFLGALLGCLSGIYLSPAATLIPAAVLITLLMIPNRSVFEKLVTPVGNFIILFILKGNRQIPLFFKKFLKFSGRTLLVKKNADEYEFIHRKIRDYFAIRRFVPLLNNSANIDRVSLVTQMSALKDASCDILLEMVRDDDRDVRKACITGLGQIGSATSTGTLMDLIKNTSGETSLMAIEELKNINDVATVPILLEALDNYPIESRIFKACLFALSGKLQRLEAWQNLIKLDDYYKNARAGYDHDWEKIHANVMTILLKHKIGTGQGAQIDYINHLISISKDVEYFYKHWQSALKHISNAELRTLYTDLNKNVVEISFLLLADRDINYAVYEILKEIKSHHLNPSKDKKNDLFPLDIIYGKASAVIKKIVEQKEADYLLAALIVLNYNVRRGVGLLSFGGKTKSVRIALMEMAEDCDSAIKTLIINYLSRISIFSNRHNDFFVKIINDSDDEVSMLAANMLDPGFMRRRSIEVCLLFIMQNADKETAHILIRKLSRARCRRLIPVLLQLLKSHDAKTVNVAINALGVLKADEARDTLLKLFYEQREEYLAELIWALCRLRERSIIPVIIKLFAEDYRLREVIISTLEAFGSEKSIMDLHQMMLSEYDKNNLESQYVLARYFTKRGNVESLIDIIYPSYYHQHNYSMYASFVRTSGYKLKRLKEIKHEELRFDDIHSLSQKGRRTKRQMRMHRVYGTWSDVFNKFNILEDEKLIIDFIYGYDQDLAREVALELFNNSQYNSLPFLMDKLQKSTNADTKQLLMYVLSKAKYEEACPIIRNYLKSDNQSLVLMAIDSLGRLSDEYSMNELLNLLGSSDESIIESTLDSIESIAYLSGGKVRNLYKIIQSNTQLQVHFITHDYTAMVRNLSSEELMKLLESDSASVRYIGTIFSSKAGQGSVIQKLNELLNDRSGLVPVSYYKHRSVSEGALFALNEIGTPSAKEYVVKWKASKNKN